MSLVAWKSRISKREGCTGIILFLEWHSAIFIHTSARVLPLFPHSLSNSVLAVTKRTGASADISALSVAGHFKEILWGLSDCLLKSVWKRVPKLKILSTDSGFKIYFITMNFYLFFFLLKTAMELPSIHWSSNNPCVMCLWTKPFWTVSCCWTKLIWSPASEFYHSNKRSLIFQVLPCLRKISPFSLAGAWDRFV